MHLWMHKSISCYYHQQNIVMVVVVVVMVLDLSYAVPRCFVIDND